MRVIITGGSVKLVEQARITVNLEERLTYYHEFQKLFMEDVPALPLYVPIYTYALGSTC